VRRRRHCRISPQSAHTPHTQTRQTHTHNATTMTPLRPHNAATDTLRHSTAAPQTFSAPSQSREGKHSLRTWYNHTNGRAGTQNKTEHRERAHRNGNGHGATRYKRGGAHRDTNKTKMVQKAKHTQTYVCRECVCGIMGGYKCGNRKMGMQNPQRIQKSVSNSVKKGAP
jgi:hypothetical protein